jgi:hypothetical protein
MDAHTLTVGFDDEETDLDKVIEALSLAGYTVPKHEQITN